MRRIPRKRCEMSAGRRTGLLAAVVVAASCSLGVHSASALEPGPRSARQTTDGPPHGSFYSETVLQSGKVLVAGGTGSGGLADTLRRCDLYDPATGEWAATGRLRRPRAFHSANLLPDGRVLVVGGYQTGPDQYLATAELYDPATETWRKAPSSSGGRQTHTATLLADGRVLVVGGYDNATYQLFDPETDKWGEAKKPFRTTEAPAEHAAVMLQDGRVLVAGGWVRGMRDYTAAAMLYDATSGRWARTGSMHFKRGFHRLVLLESGQVRVEGSGSNPPEIYDPASGTWSLVTSDVR